MEAIPPAVLAALEPLVLPLGRGDAYTGVGSHTNTPQHVLDVMTAIAVWLGKIGLTLRSGGAPECDTAFEIGAPAAQKEIFLPWKGFQKNASPRHVVTMQAYEMGMRYHPAGKGLKEVHRKLMGRNCYQVLGFDLGSPSKLLVCYTPDGADGKKKLTTRETGGTGQAIRIAADHNVPVVNLRNLLFND